MKAMFLSLGLLLVLTAAPAAAQPQYCYDFMYCQYVADSGLSQYPGPWTWGNTSWHQYVFDPCAWNGGYSDAANLPRGGAISQQFTTDEHTSWAMDLDVYFGDAGGGTADAVEVEIKNLNTGVSETHSLHAGQYGTCAGNVSFNLANDYSNANVQLTVRRGFSGWSSMSIAVDNIVFWGW